MDKSNEGPAAHPRTAWHYGDPPGSIRSGQSQAASYMYTGGAVMAQPPENETENRGMRVTALSFAMGLLKDRGVVPTHIVAAANEFYLFLKTGVVGASGNVVPHHRAVSEI